MNSKYLPSKIFIIRIAVILSIIVIVFSVTKIVKYFKNRPTIKTPMKVLVKDIVQKDSNENGIADWEEYLWGLDPYKNGPENKEFILAKRKTLAENNNTNQDDKTIVSSENEALSKEFFATVISLQQTGNLNEGSINSISEAIGEKIVATPIPDIYTISMIKTIKDSDDANIDYFNSFNNLLKKYENEDIGKELTIISQGLGTNDPQALYVVRPIATAYRNFGKELINLPAPNSIAPLQLELANNYEKTGESLDDLTKTLIDPMVGMKALINYKKYSDALVSGLDKISESLQ